MRKSLSFLLVLLLAVTLSAQVRTGNIYGRVVDTEGNPLPGVTVTLTGSKTAPMTAITSAEGNFRFISLPPANDYALKAELEGFKTVIRENIIVVVGGNVNITLTMEMGALEEEVTVVAETPVVDTKKTAVGTNVTHEVLQELPTARDPWVILQMAPSVIVDRENVGGAESGQQSSYVARGAGDYDNNVWAMDGIVITDPAAIGASPSYYDFDAFEEMQITVGGADVTIQTGGVALNMVTRRGGNRVSLGGRFYVTDGKFQADNLTDEFKAEGVRGINKIRDNKDYGFNLGGPLIKDKAWFWGSYGVQDIKTTTVYGTKDDTLLTNYAAKLNLQIIPQNRFEAFVHAGKKEKWGRSASAALPEGYAQGGRYHFGSPIVKFQDEHMFGDNLFISLKYAFSDAGFHLTPMMDLEFDDIPIWDVTDQRWYGSEWRYYVERPVNQYNFLAQYFVDDFAGASHEFKVGFEYADRNSYTESVYSGNMTVYRNYNYPTLDITGDGLPDMVSGIKYFSFWRGYYRDYGVDAYAAYISDTVSFGRFNLIVGLRYDYQTPRVNPVSIKAVDKDSGAWQKLAGSGVADKLDQMLPPVEIDKIEATAVDGSKYAWKVFSPRLGLTWDVTGDGKTIAKLSLAQYGDFMGVGEAGNWMPGGASGWLDFWWMDNGDGVMTLNELYWATLATAQPYRVFDDAGNFIGDWNAVAGVYWGSYDPFNPTKLRDPYRRVDADAGSSRTSEVMLTLEREVLPDFAVQVVGTYRRYDNFRWDLKYFPDEGIVQNNDWYVSVGTPPASIPGMGDTKEAKNHEWYVMAPEYTAYSPYSWRKKRPDFYRDYYGVDLIFNKRLSNKWMLNANFTWQHQAAHFGSEGYLDPTNLWAFDGRPYAAYIGGASGKINQYTYSRWLLKIGGLYQLPYDFNIAFTFLAREGWVIRETFDIIDYTVRAWNPRDYSRTLYMTPFATDRLPTFYNLTIRLEKMIKVGDTGRIYIMADLFNVLNSAIENRRYQKDHGDYYVYPDASMNVFVPNPNDYALNEILNPRVLRLGVRFQF